MSDSNPNEDRDEHDPDPGEPWAKTSSGDAEHITTDADEDEH